MINSMRIFYSLLIVLLFFSCKPGRTLQSVNYLNKVNDSLVYKTVSKYEPVIQPGDKLGISVTGLDPASAAQFNQSPPSTSGAQSSIPGGYIVEPDGKINFPQLGNIKVAGLTRPELVHMLSQSLSKFITNAVINVQFLNFKITVLGEINKPGTFPLPEGKINIIEAVGLGGDLTIYGNRENILVLREKNGQRELGRVDLTSTTLFSSPYYHLQQNDVVYVEMVEQKIRNVERAEMRNNLQVFTYIASIATTLVALIISLSR